MDDRDLQALDRGLLRAIVALCIVWLFVVAGPLLDWGLTRGAVILIATVGLALMTLIHVARLIGRRGRTRRSGPFAGLGPADAWEVTEAVRKGQAVGDARLAPAAVAHARQLVRLQSIGRLGLPLVIGLQAIDLAMNPPEEAAGVARAALGVSVLVVFWVLNTVGRRRAQRSDEQNLRLVVPTP